MFPQFPLAYGFEFFAIRKQNQNGIFVDITYEGMDETVMGHRYLEANF